MALVVVSNRGPLAFHLEDGELRTRRAAGGLVSALGPALAGQDATWVAAAMSDADREAARRGGVEAEGFRLRSLVLDPDDFAAYYDVVSNGTLWFLHHGLWDGPRRPRYDRFWWRAWASYRAVNERFAELVAEVAPEAATVVVHDLHLALLPALLAEARPDLGVVHFTHTPFAGPDGLRALPGEVAAELLAGMAAARACGFHARRWAANFEAGCADVLGAGSVPSTFASPAAADVEGLRAVASSPDCQQALAELDEALGDRLLLARVDRIELSKNLLRGFLAFEELLRARPEWRERVVFGAWVYPSRQSLPEYLAYRQEVEGLVRRINETWSTPRWTPVLYDGSDDFARSVAGLRRYDALLVNPVRDGLNLVAKEGPAVNGRDGVLVLSRESGVAEELGDAPLVVHPFDVAGTAEALHAALSMPAPERAAHAALVRARATARTPADWLADQLAAARPS